MASEIKIFLSNLIHFPSLATALSSEMALEIVKDKVLLELTQLTKKVGTLAYYALKNLGLKVDYFCDDAEQEIVELEMVHHLKRSER